MVRLVMSLIALSMVLVGSSAAEVPERTDSWTTLEVPPEHADLGRVYYVKYPPHSAQVTFVSDAPIERIVGTSNAVVGYLVAEIENDRPTGRIIAGAFRLPVASFDTGIPMRNNHLRGRMFFNAAEFPEIQIAVKGSEEVSVVKGGDESATYDLTLIGDLTIRDVTREGRVPTRVTFLVGSEKTKPVGDGDVLVMRCSYSVKRSEYNVGAGFMPPDLVDTMEMDQFIVLSTVSADEAARKEGADPTGKKFAVLYNDFDDKERAFAMGEAFLQNHRGDADVLNAFAWDLVLTDGENEQCFELAMKAAMRAVELTHEKNADMLSTVAFLHSEKQEFEKALAWQRKAVDHKESSENPERVEQMMKRYESALAKSK